MFVKTVATIARFPLLVLPVVLAASVNCGGGGSNSPGTAGSGGSGGSGTAGTTGTGGTGTGGTSSTKNCTVAAATAADMNILDFNTAVAAGSTPSFGSYMAGMYGGGVYIYPDAMKEADGIGLTSTFDGMTWHITGTVKTYSGFGIYLTSVTDASMFGGFQYDLGGTFTAIADGGAVPAATATLTITDVAHAVDSLHTTNGDMTCGTCAPTSSEFDGSCGAPSKVITITALPPTTTTIHWNDLMNGKRPPQFSGESPNPMSLTAIAWALPWAGAGSYMVDLTVDNIKYITP